MKKLIAIFVFIACATAPVFACHRPTPTPIEMNGERKTRGDSEIEQKLSPKEQEEFFEFSESATLLAAKDLLKKDYQLDISINTISRWLGKERKRRADDAFYKLIGEIKDDAARAELFAKEIGDAQKLTDANVTMLSQALFRARRSGDPKMMRSSAVLLSMVMEAVAKQNSSRASVISAETSRNRFQFDAAKLALKAAADLQTIQKSSGSERDKVDRAIVRLFGEQPAESGKEKA